MVQAHIHFEKFEILESIEIRNKFEYLIQNFKQVCVIKWIASIPILDHSEEVLNFEIVLNFGFRASNL